MVDDPVSEGFPPPPAPVIEFLSTLRLPPGTTVEEIFEAQAEAMWARPWPVVGELRKRVPIAAPDGGEGEADLVLPEGGARPRPLLLYVHGGGWEYGAPASHRRVAHELASRGFAVLVPRYRLGPEHRHPAQLEDLDAALEWGRANLVDEGVDPAAPVAVGGDSAGAHLAAALAIRRSLEGREGIGAALLLTGVFEYHEGLPLLGPRGHDEASQPLLERAEFAALRDDPVVNPLLGAARMPPSYVGVGGADPFASQGRRFFAALEAAGVSAELDFVADAPHGFHLLPGLPEARPGFDRAAAFAHRRLEEAAVAR